MTKNTLNTLKRSEHSDITNICMSNSLFIAEKHGSIVSIKYRGAQVTSSASFYKCNKLYFFWMISFLYKLLLSKTRLKFITLLTVSFLEGIVSGTSTCLHFWTSKRGFQFTILSCTLFCINIFTRKTSEKLTINNNLHYKLLILINNNMALKVTFYSSPHTNAHLLKWLYINQNMNIYECMYYHQNGLTRGCMHASHVCMGSLWKCVYGLYGRTHLVDLSTTEQCVHTRRWALFYCMFCLIETIMQYVHLTSSVKTFGIFNMSFCRFHLKEPTRLSCVFCIWKTNQFYSVKRKQHMSSKQTSNEECHMHVSVRYTYDTSINVLVYSLTIWWKDNIANIYLSAEILYSNTCARSASM